MIRDGDRYFNWNTCAAVAVGKIFFKKTLPRTEIEKLKEIDFELIQYTYDSYNMAHKVMINKSVKSQSVGNLDPGSFSVQNELLQNKRNPKLKLNLKNLQRP